MKKAMRVFAVLLVLMLAVSCGNNGSDETESAPPKETATDAGEEKKDSEKEETETAEMKDISDEEFKNALEGDAIVVDTRASDAYIGWDTGDGVTGHPEGATDFSYRWLTSEYDDKENLEEETREEVLTQAVEAKDLDSGEDIVLYDSDRDHAAEIYGYLKDKTDGEISFYDIKDYDGELVQYPQYELLLSPTVVKDYIDTGSGETLDDDLDYKIFNVAWGEVDQSGYLDGHVPGAVHVNTDWFEPEELNWMLADDDHLEDLALKLGVTADDGAIVTGPEPMAATRFATVLHYLGVKDVRVMNGALIDWQDYGYELETKNNEPVAATSFGADVPVRPDVIDTIEETQGFLKDRDNYVLVDNRTPEEWRGETSGYSYHDKKGRIEGAVFGYAGKKSSSSMSYYRNIDKTMRNGNEILKMLDKCGIDTDDHMAFMCGSGWRAAEAMWYMRVMGFEDVSLFSDGWIGWSNAGLPSINESEQE